MASLKRIPAPSTITFRDLPIKADAVDEDAHAKLGVLRRILAGGTMTPEKAARHKRQDDNPLCSCGMGMENVEGVSWECLECAEERNAVISQLTVRVEDLPVCFRYAAVVPRDFLLSDDEIRLVQIFQVKIWQHHLIPWYSGGDPEHMARVQHQWSSSRTPWAGRLLVQAGRETYSPGETGAAENH